MHTSQLGVPPFKSIPRTLNTFQEKQFFRRVCSWKFIDFMGEEAPLMLGGGVFHEIL